MSFLTYLTYLITWSLEFSNRYVDPFKPLWWIFPAMSTIWKAIFAHSDLWWHDVECSSHAKNLVKSRIWEGKELANNNNTRSGGIGGVSGKFSIFGAFAEIHRLLRKCDNVQNLRKSLTLIQQDWTTTKLEVIKHVALSPDQNLIWYDLIWLDLTWLDLILIDWGLFFMGFSLSKFNLGWLGWAEILIFSSYSVFVI